MTVTFDLEQYRAQVGRRRAQRSGAEHEQLVDAELNALQHEGRLVWRPTGPPVKWLKKGHIVPIGEGPADRLIGCRGRAIWLEIKAWGNKSQCTYRSRLNQFESMVAFARHGFIGSYMVRWNGVPEWRLHPLSSLSKVVDGVGKKGYGLLFNRESGIYVPANALGVPRLGEALEELLCSD